MEGDWGNLARVQPQPVQGPMHTSIPASIQAGIHKPQQAACRPAQPDSNPQNVTTKDHNDLQYKILGSFFLEDPDKPCTQGADKTNCRAQEQGPSRPSSQPATTDKIPLNSLVKPTKNFKGGRFGKVLSVWEGYWCSQQVLRHSVRRQFERQCQAPKESNVPGGKLPKR